MAHGIERPADKRAAGTNPTTMKVHMHDQDYFFKQARQLKLAACTDTPSCMFWQVHYTKIIADEMKRKKQENYFTQLVGIMNLKKKFVGKFLTIT